MLWYARGFILCWCVPCCAVVYKAVCLLAAGRLIWMIPPADQPSSQDTHIPVADPDNHQEPATDSNAHRHPQTDSNQPSSSSTAAEDNGSFHRIGFVSSEDAEHAKPAQNVLQPQPILLDVKKECFSRMLLLPEMITDHLPETYLAAVQQL